MHQLVELTPEECLSLLSKHSVGRLAMVTPGGLRIYPVNYALFGDTVVFRTLPYGEIANAAHGAEVAFQIDELDTDLRRGWSVLVVGKASKVEDPGMVRMIKQEWDPEPWAAGQRNLYFQVQWSMIGGRQAGMPERPTLIPASRSSL